MMPGMDGYEVCRQLKLQAATRDIPVIFLTACADAEAERAGLEAGAVDYVTKPFNPPVLLARVKTHLALKAQADFLRDKSAFLEAEVDKRTRRSGPSRTSPSTPWRRLPKPATRRPATTSAAPSST
jgi:putative two-component system response regulator